jgi:predicted phosphate transport protein (TIGR00153 family)
MTLARLFGKSPFGVLQTHMAKVAKCVEQIPLIFDALLQKKYDKVQEIASLISKLEHEADCTKDTIRNNLSSGLFLPIARSSLLEILTAQDTIADRAEDTAILLTLRNLEFFPEFTNEFQECLKKNLDTFHQANQIIQELTDLLESSFGGVEADKVRSMVESVAIKEHEADLLQRKLLKKMFTVCDGMPYPAFFLWMKVIQELAALSDQSEKLANRVRMTLEVK